MRRKSVTTSKTKYPRIEVHWADHFFCEEDMSLKEIKDEAKGPLIGRYTGYLVEENKRMLVLASNIWEGEEEESISPTMYIMKKAIVYRSDKRGSK